MGSGHLLALAFALCTSLAVAQEAQQVPKTTPAGNAAHDVARRSNSAKNRVRSSPASGGRRLLIQNKRGGASVNPLLGIIRKASRDAVHYATLLGLTSSARATLEVKPQPNDPMDKYFGSKS